MSERRFGVIGGGSWATAIIKMLTMNLDEVNWWIRNEKSVEYIKKHHHNPKYIRSTELDVAKLKLTTNLVEVVKNSEVLILATPSAFYIKPFRHWIKTRLKVKQ